MPDGSIVLMGGGTSFGGLGMNDVWRSTDNGANWTQQTPSAAWSARYAHSSVAMPDGSIVLMGGWDVSSNRKNDVWRSTDNGVTWTQVTPSAGWSERASHSSVVMPDGSIVLIGGEDDAGFKNDVWRSTDNGATWTQQTANAGWSARSLFSSVAMPDGNLVLMGGTTSSSGSGLNDVWKSIDNGATWTQMTPSAAWSARAFHSSVAMPDGSIVLMGGNGDGVNYTNDTWRSTNNGATWTQMAANTAWSARYYHTSVAMTDGSIVLMGGYDGSRKNDVWRFTPVSSSAQNPSHIYTTPGIYPVVLQAYNTVGYNISGKTNYITVTGSPSAPVANFTGTPRTGIAPLNVQFTDTSSGTEITSYQWIFSDNSGTVFTSQNLSHTFTNPGTYHVNHSVTNSVSTVWKNETGYITVIASPVAAAPGWKFRHCPKLDRYMIK
jgi:hypothetical protein